MATNLSQQARRITGVAVENSPESEDRIALRRLEQDGLMGPYATVVKYRQFSPSPFNLESQLASARKTAAWRPLDLVKVRETMLLVIAERGDEACDAARRTTERYPAAGPILAQKVVAASMGSDIDIGAFMSCIETGLEPWGVNLGTMQQRNQKRIDDLLQQRSGDSE